MMWLALILSAAEYEGGKPGTGTILGRVLLDKLPAPKKYAVTKNADKCGREKADQAVIYSSDKGLKNVVVWIDNVRVGKDPIHDTVVLKNITCVYEPRVSVAGVGATLELRNYDGLQMSAAGFLRPPVFGFTGAAGTPLFNVALPVKGLTAKRKMDKPGLIDIRTDSGQPWMQAWVWVFDQPYAAVSDEGGYFSLDKVPPGEVILNVWHETLGYKSEKLVVPATDPARVELVL